MAFESGVTYDLVQGGKKPWVEVCGVKLTGKQIEQAILALTTTPGNQVKVPLLKIDHPLSVVDLDKLAAAHGWSKKVRTGGGVLTKREAIVTALHLANGQLATGFTGKPMSKLHQLAWSHETLTNAAIEAEKKIQFAQWMHALDTTAAKLELPEETFLSDPTEQMVLSASTVETTVPLEPATTEQILELFSSPKPEWVKATDQPVLSGYHPKFVLERRDGSRWLFKPAPAGKPFRAEVEHHAHRLARDAGYATAESELITFDGQFGQAQRMYVEAGNFAGVTGAAFTNFTAEQLAAVAAEHVLDWLIDNDDTKGDNLLITDAGEVVGVDKARAWRYFGSWDGLSSHDSADTNAPLVYTALYQAIKDGHLAGELVDQLYLAAIAAARRIRRMPDPVVAEHVRAAVTSRPKWGPPSYIPAHPDAPGNADELVTAVLARKNAIVDDIRGLWERVYDATGAAMPDIDASRLPTNPQGHPLHAGLHDPALHQAVAKTKSYGTPAFVAGVGVEDGHVLLWRERYGPTNNRRYLVRGQCKLRAGSYTNADTWCAAQNPDFVHYVPGMPPLKEDRVENELWSGLESVFAAGAAEEWYRAGAIAHSYATRCDSYHRAIRQQLEDPVRYPDPFRALAQSLDMLTCYKGYLTTLAERFQHVDGPKPVDRADYPRFHYNRTPATTEPDSPPDPALDPTQPGYRIVLQPVTRAVASTNGVPTFSPDGELDLDPDGRLIAAEIYPAVRDRNDDLNGQEGAVYRITLPTGETIDLRTQATKAPKALQGLLEFTVYGLDDNLTGLAAGLRRITRQLATMGVPLDPADPLDLELYYWRHLAGVMDSRRDANRSFSHKEYKPFWQTVNERGLRPSLGVIGMTRTQEAAAWREAFATIPGTGGVNGIIHLLADGRHLPVLPHMDLRQPDMPCGKPYWYRPDIGPKQVAGPLWMEHRTGPRSVCLTGAALATEARLRTLGIWKQGVSSHEDMHYGSSAFLFTRQAWNAHNDDHRPTLILNPNVLRRTTTYSLPCDRFGAPGVRRELAYFKLSGILRCTDEGNETLVKDAVTLLDDIELAIFPNTAQRSEAILRLQELGITHIRGVKLADRLILREDLHDAYDRLCQALRGGTPAPIKTPDKELLGDPDDVFIKSWPQQNLIAHGSTLTYKDFIKLAKSSPDYTYKTTTPVTILAQQPIVLQPGDTVQVTFS